MAFYVIETDIKAYDAHCESLGVEGDIEGLFRFTREQKIDCPVGAGTVKSTNKVNALIIAFSGMNVKEEF